MKIYPSEKEFLKFAKQGVVIPVFTEMLSDMHTPVSSFQKVAKDEKYAFLLESVEIGEKLGRYSVVGISPSIVISSKGSQITMQSNGKKKTYTTYTNPLQELKNEMKKYKFHNFPSLPPICAGFVGYIGYDMVRFIEKIPDKNPDNLDMDEMLFMLSNYTLVFDNINFTLKVVANVIIEKEYSEDQLLKLYKSAVYNLKQICKTLDNEIVKSKKPKNIKKPKITSNFSKAQFENAVQRVKQYIQRGDIIQAVISQRFESEYSGDSFNIYRCLRSINPSPYMFFLKLDGAELVGSSPEILVRSSDNTVEVRPIAGTRKRGKNEADDRRLEKELLSDPKEIAEHIMLVDLGRNDIGRVCKYGTVSLTEKMIIERYSHVMHIVSNCVGKLAPRKDSFDVIKATFPAGTVSGAPKIRAMEIIDEMETVKRGPYAGCVGYFGFQGNMDMCITIRTVMVKDGVAYIQTGAGIVADSQPALEYKETKNKAMAMLKALEKAYELE